ncbi:hypothetical protein P4S72_09120 [Vibrio sp. PP-XX7]
MRAEKEFTMGGGCCPRFFSEFDCSSSCCSRRSFFPLPKDVILSEPLWNDLARKGAGGYISAPFIRHGALESQSASDSDGACICVY